MAQDSDFDGRDLEEIDLGPPVESRSELRERRLSESIAVNSFLNQRVQQMVYRLLQAEDLGQLLESLLVNMPRHFGFRAAELWLHDPEGMIAELIPDRSRFDGYLTLTADAFDMQQLYAVEPESVLLDSADPRMLEVFKSQYGIENVLLLPLLDGDRMIGSLHCDIRDAELARLETAKDPIAHLVQVIGLCFKNSVSRQQISQLTMLDPLTHISNLRGFERDIAREISRSRRGHQSLSVLSMEIDGFDELYLQYGQSRAHFVMKKVAQRISSDLRATDYMARLSDSTLAVLLPACAENQASDIAERMRRDVDEFSVDDGRGAILHVTLSLGVVTWDPDNYPAVDMAQLAKQMQKVGNRALESARSGGGNSVSVARLNILSV